MSTFLLSTYRPKVIPATLVLGVIYAIGIPAFVFLWSGGQSIPGFAGFEQYGLLYAAICLLGVICNLAVTCGQRWGVIGQLGVWGITSAVNIVLQREIAPYVGLALLMIGFWIFDVYRNRRLLG
jgi:hypothetical protein